VWQTLPESREPVGDSRRRFSQTARGADLYEVLIQGALLVVCGVAWRVLRPFGLDADTTRRVLSSLVYGLLLPALVLKVLWTAPLGLDIARVASLAAAGIVLGIVAAIGAYRVWGTPRHEAGALLLATAFGNVTYLGLPVLDSVFGAWSHEVAIEYDLFASTPLLLTVGVLLAQSYGGVRESGGFLSGLLRVPPLWAALLAVALNLGGAPLPSWLAGLLDRLAAGVTPLMLIVVGLGLAWQRDWSARLVQLVPLVVIKLALLPWAVWALAPWLGVRGQLLSAVVLEAAMPSMVLGIVLCERYRLDSALYAEAVTVTTALSLVTLPLWLAWLQ
jgi:predicted permease